MNHTELDIIVAELMFPILVEIAPTGDTVGYLEIANLIKERNPEISEIRNITQRHIGRKLGTIWAFTKSKRCPHIGSLVVNASGECGDGIRNEISDLPAERLKVKNFDWSTVSLDFNSHIAKVKIKKVERETKKEKVTREKAKQSFYYYWKLIQSEAPVTKNEVLLMQESILEKIQAGDSVEEAFSFYLLEHIANNENDVIDSTIVKASGFVYIGEYINGETGEPLFDQYKIGFSKNLELRAETLGGGVKGPLTFVMLNYWEFDANVAYAIEQAMHGKFKSHRRIGEFFTNIDSLLIELVDDQITQHFGNLLKATNYD